MPKTENRGGARAGAGRKPQTKEYSDQFKKKLWGAMKKKAKSVGKDIFELIADMIYDRKVQAAVRSSLIKLVAETMVVKESKKTVENYEFGPKIYLPEPQKKPQEVADKEAEFKSNLTH